MNVFEGSYRGMMQRETEAGWDKRIDCERKRGEKERETCGGYAKDIDGHETRACVEGRFE